jgi:hypothetical protein
LLRCTHALFGDSK